jgi:hypothetical protein
VPVAVLGEGAKKLLGPLMEKVAVPVVTKVITAPSQVLAKLAIEVGAKVLVDQAKKAGQIAVRGNVPQNLHAGASCRCALHWETLSASTMTCC